MINAIPIDKKGLIFNQNDYAHFLSRLFADVIDAIIIIVGYILIVLLSPEYYWNIPMLIWLSLSAIYLVYFKAFTEGTIGYRIAKIKLIDYYGNRPSIWAVLMRTLFAIFGPLNYGLDLLWIGSDKSFQALRDKVVATLVIRKNATPISKGTIQYRRYDFFSWNIIFPEIENSDDKLTSHLS
jgi:uncharacterized RDD family membrane protein YckC